MGFRNLFAIPLFALILTAAAFADSVKVDYDHSTNFNQLKTYSWKTVNTANSLWDKRVKDAVDSELGAKGWTQVRSGGDVQIVASEKTSVHQQFNTTYDGLGGRRFGGLGMSTTSLDSYKVGTLFVDMFEGPNNQLIWKGTSSADLTGNPDKNQKKLDKDVRDMFKRFPPKAGE
jgi:hypothetical protein